MGEGLAGSTGGSDRLPWAGPIGDGSIVELLALGVAISNADWRERVGEAGGERSSSSAARVHRVTSGRRENNRFGSGGTPERGRSRAGVTIPVSRSVGASAVGASRW